MEALARNIEIFFLVKLPIFLALSGGFENMVSIVAAGWQFVVKLRRFPCGVAIAVTYSSTAWQKSKWAFFVLTTRQ